MLPIVMAEMTSRTRPAAPSRPRWAGPGPGTSPRRPRHLSARRRGAVPPRNETRAQAPQRHRCSESGASRPRRC